ncbi:hypothetical protein CRENBAI_003558 [Crenichthys baileyi]|uniref:Uncharacterized protein n=1 Tax=Crenichthys baileyi TaxID=28760 RepID=A0AAV9SL87_9TELE
MSPVFFMLTSLIDTAQLAARPGVRAKEGSIGRRPPQHTKDQAPANPTPKFQRYPSVPATHTPTRYTPMHRLAGQPLHQSEATSQSTPHTARPRPPRKSPAPPTEARDRDPRKSNRS